MKKIVIILALAAVVFAVATDVWAQGKLATRPPEFKYTGHKPPYMVNPAPRALWQEYLDVGVLAAALSLASWIALKRRSRREMVWLTIFSVVYFGFWRKGCVCSVGAVQNVVQSIVDGGYAVPLIVLLFFLVPLVFTLFFGRTFCAAVCPLGAAQELVVFRPMKLPPWLNHMLGLFPYAYLGLAVWFAACGGDYIICKYDPFIGLYRLGAEFNLLVFGVGLLVIGMFIGRPYCRFLCPYGVLLSWMSKLSRRHVSITPEDCIQCRLCEEACPYDTILEPTPEKGPEPRHEGVRRLVVLIVLFPVLVLGGGYAGSKLGLPAAMTHRKVWLAEQVHRVESGSVTMEILKDENPNAHLDVEKFQESKDPVDELYTEALVLRGRFTRGGWLFGAFMGLVVGWKLISLSIRRKREDWEADRLNCVSCTRCFWYCPKEHERQKMLSGEAVEDNE